jgi:hypothetical protein
MADGQGHLESAAFGPQLVPPSRAIWACLYLACKSDEFYKPVNELAMKISQFLKQDPEALALASQHQDLRAEALEIGTWCVELELVLLQGLKFHLSVYHPFRPLFGIWQFWRQLSNAGTATDEELSRLHASAQEWIWTLYSTTAVLTISPPLQAWVVLRMACDEHEGSMATFDHLVRVHGSAELVELGWLEAQAALSVTRPTLAEVLTS